MEIQDLVIVGAGPAGLSAAISGASELERVVLLDSGRKVGEENYEPQLGGQALGSSLIENYAGFPHGISGKDLMTRFGEQAEILGTRILTPRHAADLELVDKGLKLVKTREGDEFLTRSVVLSNGLSYRKLEAVGVKELLGKGILYGAPTSNPRELGQCTVCIVGAANSAGQAVMHLSQNPDIKIRLLVRGDKTIESQMSKYLVDRIHGCKTVEVMQNISVVGAFGKDRLESLRLLNGLKEESYIKTDHLFIFIGAAPKVEWLQGAIQVDRFGFIATGNDLGTLFGRRETYETSMPGVFAAGDVRFGSVKRVAAGVGEGSAAVSMVHRYLADNGR